MKAGTIDVPTSRGAIRIKELKGFPFRINSRIVITRFIPKYIGIGISTRLRTSENRKMAVLSTLSNMNFIDH